jgi:hypothetical protein
MDGIVQRKKPAKMCATASASSSDAAAELIPDRAGGKTECRIAMPIHNAENKNRVAHQPHHLSNTQASR